MSCAVIPGRKGGYSIGSAQPQDTVRPVFFSLVIDTALQLCLINSRSRHPYAESATFRQGVGSTIDTDFVNQYSAWQTSIRGNEASLLDCLHFYAFEKRPFTDFLGELD